MALKMRRNFFGAVSAHIAGDGTWRLRAAPIGAAPLHAGGRVPTPTAQIIVVGVDAHVMQACGATLRDVCIEWREPRVVLTLISEGPPQRVEASGAIVHEPLPDLYAGLPLAKFDERARRFWRRVFLLVKIPGGRRLLGMLAHASRNKP